MIKFTSLATLAVATTVASINLVNVSPATAALMRYDLQLNDLEVESLLLGGFTTVDVDAGSFTMNTSMDTIEWVDLKVGNLSFNQGEFVMNDIQMNILFSNSAQPSQSLTLFALPPLPQEIGGSVTGQAMLINGNYSQSVSSEVAAVAYVPEPLTLLGSAAALGFGVALKQEHSRKKNKVN